MTRASLSLLIALGFFSVSAPAQSFDTSGNSLLNGTYFFRYVSFDNLSSSTGAPGRMRSLTGNVTFNGNGNYTMTAQSADSTSSAGAASAFSFNGSYAVSSSGLLRMQSPLSTSDSLFGGVGRSSVAGSSTESATIQDMFIAIPTSGTPTNASLQGAYRIASIGFPSGNITQAVESTGVLTADGSGNLSSVTLTGQSASNSNTEATQNITGATYSFGASGNVFTFPSSSSTQFLSGSKQFAISSDGNIILGGAANSFDILVGVKGTSGITNATVAPTYYCVGMDYDTSNEPSSSYFDTFYGSVNTNGLGATIEHQRISPNNDYTYDYTYDDQFNIGADGGVTQQQARFYFGANGLALVQAGRGAVYNMEFCNQAITKPVSGPVVLNPLGISNAASFTPITTPIAQGEMIQLYGTNLASGSATSQSLPLPNSLSGVSVSVNGRPAPVFSVTPNRIVAIVPYATTEAYAQVQVTNNGTASNTVTLYTNASAPGLFTVNSNGVGDAVVTHQNNSLVTSSNQAATGETVTAYLTGLGDVNPRPNDGAGALGNPLSNAVNTFQVYVDGVQANVTYAGLAPGFPGLYQINFTVPSTPDTGDVYLDIYDTDSGFYASQALLNISGKSASAATAKAKHQTLRTLRPAKSRATSIDRGRTR